MPPHHWALHVFRSSLINLPLSIQRLGSRAMVEARRMAAT